MRSLEIKVAVSKRNQPETRLRPDLSHIEAGKIFLKDVPLYQQVEKVATAHILEYLSDMKSK